VAIPKKGEQAILVIRESVIPALRQHEGRILSLHEEWNRRGAAVWLWAEAAEAERAEHRARVLSGLGMTLESADLYEGPVVELELLVLWPRSAICRGPRDRPRRCELGFERGLRQSRREAVAEMAQLRRYRRSL
jgi:hypothetical protein